jgi:CDP-6-deoxy-D-xylo-4-hexulose-3-dehydrase
MFSGNITRHPAYKDSEFRAVSLKNSDFVMRQSFWITCHPRLKKKDLDYIVKTFEEYV